MKKNVFFKLMTATLCCLILFGQTLLPVRALESDVVQPYAYETYTKTQDFGLGEDRGYVTVTLKIKYNIESRIYYLLSATVDEHFLPTLPTYKLIGSVSTNPSTGSAISGGVVKVTFSYTNGLYGVYKNDWTHTVSVSI